MHYGGITGDELKGYRQHDIAATVENARIIAELHVLPVDSSAIALFGQDFSAFEDISNEHGALPLWLRLEEMEILPDGTSDRAWNPDIVLQAGQSFFDSQRDYFPDDCPALHCQSPVDLEFQSLRFIADNQTSESLIANEDVRAQAQYEVGNGELPCC